MKKTFALFIGLLFLSLPSASAEMKQPFSDISQTHPNYVAINHLVEMGVLNGYEDGSFKPNNIVNRAEALKIILKGSGIDGEEEAAEGVFSDVANNQWFAPFVIKAKNLGIVSGNPDGTFTPAATVTRAGFLKMLLETNRFKKDKWAGQNTYADVSGDAWYAPYLNYAGKSGLLIPTKDGKLKPEQELTRAEVSEILYLMKLIINGTKTQFLVDQAELHMAQVEIYVGDKQVIQAKRSSELGFDLTQQALKNLPENNVILAAAKIAKAYDLLVDAYIAGLQDRNDDARSLAELTKVKATEAWEADNTTQAIARHIKDRADEILSQL